MFLFYAGESFSGGEIMKKMWRNCKMGDAVL
jgi:hypothetical protein